MAEMKLGYGSEYQLLRCLGHHRNSFYSEILKVIDKENSDNSDIEWLDYPIDNSKDSLDGEWKDIECFKGRINDYFQIQNQWNAFWPTKGNSQNWDGIFIYKGVWYFVEAKAHIKESIQRCSAGDESRKKILNSFEKVTGSHDEAMNWINSKYYQLANRIAFISFCKRMNIQAKLCYILFTHGYRICPTKNNTTVEDWNKQWEEMRKALNIPMMVLNDIYKVNH